MAEVEAEEDDGAEALVSAGYSNSPAHQSLNGSMTMSMTSSVLNGTKRRWLAVALSAALLIATEARAQERFAGPKEAAQALVTAAKTNDFSRILAILGPAGRDIVESGDKVADKNALDKFLTAYDVKSRISNESDDSARS